MAQALRALLVGIEKYEGSVSPLRGCAADVDAMVRFLTGRLGVPADQICILTDGAATRQAILSAWQEHLIAAALPGDQLFFHFSGHGSQAPSIDPNEADGLDETLVAFDSRLPGGRDLLDKELGYLIRRAEARQAQVSVLLDCCHSGSGTRQGGQPAVRRVAPREDAPVPAALLAEPGALLEAVARPTAHVLLSAAYDNELANEIYLADSGQWRGAASYFFLEALRDFHPDLTWAEVHDQVLARVHVLYPRQSPQLVDPDGRLLFGAGMRPVERYLRVLQTGSDGRIQVDGGAAIGLAPGALLAIYRPGDTQASRPSALATVEAVAAGAAWAGLERAATVAQGSRAAIVGYGYHEQRHWVAVDDDRVAGKLAAAHEGKPSPFLRLATGAGQPPVFTVRTTPAGYQIEDATGSAIGIPAPATDPGAAAVVAQLEHLAIFRNVLMLRNPAAGASLSAALHVVGPRRTGAAESESPLVVRLGDRVEFSLTNRSASTVFLAIFRLGADYSIVRIKPEAERNLALAPGRAASIRVIDTIGDAHGTEAFDWVRYKIFVMTERIDLDVLQLPPLGAGTPAAQAVVRADSPLGSLLEGVRRTGTRPMRPPGSTRDDKWCTIQLEVKIVPPDGARLPRA